LNEEAASMMQETTGAEGRPLQADLDELLQRHNELVAQLIERFGLPLHLFFLEPFRNAAAQFKTVLQDLKTEGFAAFAVKCNPCRGAVRAAERAGLGADVVSEHELSVALEEGIAPGRIVCNGNAKSDRYLRQAVDAGCLLAVDGTEELALIDAIGRATGRRIPVLLRVSGLDVAGFTSSTQTTAHRWSKFGFAARDLPAILGSMPNRQGIRFDGFSAHIGTQLCDPRPYLALLAAFRTLAQTAREHGLRPRVFDLGGGWPVNFLSEVGWARFVERLRDQVRGRLPMEAWVTWDGDPMGLRAVTERGDDEATWKGKAYWSAHPGASMLDHVMRSEMADGKSLLDALTDTGTSEIIVEPGRSLAAPAGVTLAEVRTVKTVAGHAVVALDLGINNHGTNLLAPDIFPATVLPAGRGSEREAEVFLAGRLCFGGDMLTTAKISLNRIPRRGDRMAIYFTGAYSADHFASHSCGFPIPAKVAIDDAGRWTLWRRAEHYSDVFPAL
jgi:diaminopimelate decarboxylase